MQNITSRRALIRNGGREILVSSRVTMALPLVESKERHGE
jgi:hypothetical protein